MQPFLRLAWVIALLIAVLPTAVLAEPSGSRVLINPGEPGSADDSSLTMMVIEFDSGNESFVGYLDALTLFNSGEPFEEKNWTMDVELFAAPLSTMAAGWCGSTTDTQEPRSVALLLLRYGIQLHIWELSLDADATGPEAVFLRLLEIAERRFTGSFEGQGDHDLLRQLPTPELIGPGWEIASDEYVSDWQSL